nr:unnamed protein product [Callosobruchus analis]
MDRGGRPSRGRGYQYGGGGRGTYDGSWGGPGAAGGPGVQGDPTGDQWSPRKEYSEAVWKTGVGHGQCPTST